MKVIIKGLDLIEETLVAGSVLIVVVINFFSIATREIEFGVQMGQAQEVMILMFVWITFLGIPLATKRKAHLGLSLLTDSLSPKKQRVMGHIALFISLGFLATLGYYGVLMVIQEYTSQQTTPALGLPMWPFGSAVVVSAVLSAFRLLEVAYRDFNWGGKGEAQR